MSGLAGRKLLRATCALALVMIFARVISATGAYARPMAFKLAPLNDPRRCRAHCPAVISASGEIVDSTPQDYVNFLARHINDSRLRIVVFLNSPGGKVLASMKFGELLRRSSALAIVARIRGARPGIGQRAAIGPGYCFSACVYALMGGKKRVIPPTSVAGIHRMFVYGRSPDPDSMDRRRRKVYGADRFEAELKAYTAMMGVSKQLITKAESVSANSIHILTSQELRRWRLAVRRY